MMEGLLAAYNSVRSTTALPKTALSTLKVAAIAVSSERFQRPGWAELSDTVATLERDCEGWSRRQSWRAVCPSKPSPDDAGLPIAGEWAISDMASRQLTLRGEEWVIVQISEMADRSSGARLCLRQDVSLVASRDAGARTLDYAIYWAGDPDDPAGVRRIASRFLGFGGKHAIG